MILTTVEPEVMFINIYLKNTFPGAPGWMVS